MKLTWCAPTHQEPSDHMKSVARGAIVWEISMLQTKPTTFPHDR